MYRLMLDTNILLDALISQRPESQAARDVLSRCNGEGDMGMASSLSLKDVYYVSCKAYGEPWARNALRLLMGLVVIAPVSAEECDSALNSPEPDFEDGIIRACAELNDADFLITRDGDAFSTCTIRSVTATQYLDIVARMR